MIHTVKGFGIVNKAEIDVFLELFCFLDDPTDVDNLISGSSAFLNPAFAVIIISHSKGGGPLVRVMPTTALTQVFKSPR